MSDHAPETVRRTRAVSAAVELIAVVTDYRSLRPLRIRHLTVAAGERVALLGLEPRAAETVLDLIAGAMVPDDGEVRVLGRSTREIRTPDAWLESLELLGLVTPRAVLLEALSVVQNVALALTVRLDPPSAADAASAEALADEVGIAKDAFGQPASAIGAAARLRVRVARALAPGPKVLALDHPTAGLSAMEVATFATDLARVAAARRLAVLVLTDDRRLGAQACHRSLRVRPATGDVEVVRTWRWPRWSGGV